LLGKSHVVFAVSPGVARAAIAGEGSAAPPALAKLPETTAYFSQSDPRGSLPELLVNLPSMVQLIGGIATSQPNQSPERGRFSLLLDPDVIPAPDALRSYLFPKTTTIFVDDRAFSITTREAFPSADVNLGVGTSGPVLVALLLPALQAAREAARRAQCMNNLKQIGIAMHMYHDAYNTFPGNIRDKSGKPLLSWRVAILPYMEENALYEKFRLDEPWDSPHNRELLKYMPKSYICPSRPPAGDQATTYRAFTGNGAIFDERGPTRIAQIRDGTSNTILVVEASEAVPWTKPDDIPFQPDRPENLFGAGSSHPGGFNALFCDGSVRFIKTTIDLDVLKALITRDGGEVIGGADIP
jgi:prepilin-type processing-associated H-X9-DG protein